MGIGWYVPLIVLPFRLFNFADFMIWYLFLDQCDRQRECMKIFLCATDVCSNDIGRWGEVTPSVTSTCINMQMIWCEIWFPMSMVTCAGVYDGCKFQFCLCPALLIKRAMVVSGSERPCDKDKPEHQTGGSFQWEQFTKSKQYFQNVYVVQMILPGVSTDWCHKVTNKVSHISIVTLHNSSIKSKTYDFRFLGFFMNLDFLWLYDFYDFRFWGHKDVLEIFGFFLEFRCKVGE